jgi:uncharacterized membrane protein YraQ (UPF0718 family)
MKKNEASRTGWYFLLIVIGIYIITYLIKPDFLIPALNFAWNIFLKIIPVFILIFALMFIINYFITPKWLAEKLEKSKGIKAWSLTIIAGVISTGPIYMWYPMLAELKEHGLKQGLMATFLYARAVKPALMPLMIYYFGLTFTIILTIVMIVFSIIQGEILQKIMEV